MRKERTENINEIKIIKSGKKRTDKIEVRLIKKPAGVFLSWGTGFYQALIIN